MVKACRTMIGHRVRMVAAAGMHSLALTDEGEIWIWGEPWGDFSLGASREPHRCRGPACVVASRAVDPTSSAAPLAPPDVLIGLVCAPQSGPGRQGQGQEDMLRRVPQRCADRGRARANLGDERLRPGESREHRPFPTSTRHSHAMRCRHANAPARPPLRLLPPNALRLSSPRAARTRSYVCAHAQQQAHSGGRP